MRDTRDNKGVAASPPGSQASPAAASASAPSVSIPNASELVRRLGPIVAAGERACVDGTPMIPLHRDTVAAILRHLETLVRQVAPGAICGYPLPNWRLQRVEYDDGEKLHSAPGWIVELRHESRVPDYACRGYFNVMARSLLGPLEAWDEAIQIAHLENERAASVDRSGEAGETGSEADGLDPKDESAVPAKQADAPTESGQ